MAQLLNQTEREKRNALQAQLCVKSQELCKLNAVNVNRFRNVYAVDLGVLQHFSEACR